MAAILASSDRFRPCRDGSGTARCAEACLFHRFGMIRAPPIRAPEALFQGRFAPPVRFPDTCLSSPLQPTEESRWIRSAANEPGEFRMASS